MKNLVRQHQRGFTLIELLVVIAIIAIAPAVSNAIFDATAIRLRHMPMIPDGLKA